MTPICPSCGSVFDKLPLRKTKCKSCGLYAYPRAIPQDPEKILVTAQRAKEIESLWNDDWSNRRKIAEASELLDEIGIPVGPRQLRISTAIAKYDESKNWSEKRIIASTVAFCAHSDNLNPRHWELEATICELNQIESMPSWHQYLFVSNGSSQPHCKALEGRRFTLSQAREEMPIPAHRCTNDRNAAGFARCQCTWMIDLEEARSNRVDGAKSDGGVRG